jgi:hypothetical protein
VFLDFGSEPSFIANQNQFKTRDLIQGKLCRSHGHTGPVVPPHGVECDNFLSHLAVSEKNTGGYCRP